MYFGQIYVFSSLLKDTLPKSKTSFLLRAVLPKHLHYKSQLNFFNSLSQMELFQPLQQLGTSQAVT